MPVKPGDFFFIPSGTVHALGKGILLLEVQQNSDITYRIYDYDRTGLDGDKRELHIRKAIDNINFRECNMVNPYFIKDKGVRKKFLVSCNYFNVEEWSIDGFYKAGSLDVFLLVYVLDGEGELKYDQGSLSLTEGSSFMVPAGLGIYQIVGNIKVIVSYMSYVGINKKAFQTSALL